MTLEEAIAELLDPENGVDLIVLRDGHKLDVKWSGNHRPTDVTIAHREDLLALDCDKAEWIRENARHAIDDRFEDLKEEIHEERQTWRRISAILLDEAEAIDIAYDRIRNL